MRRSGREAGERPQQGGGLRNVSDLIDGAPLGAFSAATAFASTPGELLAYRFLTGLGLGGAMPNIIALTSEYAPKRLRATLVTLMFCGFPLGAVLGGLVSARLIAAFGYPSATLSPEEGMRSSAPSLPDWNRTRRLGWTNA